MNTITYGSTTIGVGGKKITVEVYANRGLPSIKIVGMPDRSIREAAERVVAVNKSIGTGFSMKKIRVNLAPTEIPKHGSGLDLPIAIGIFAAIEKIKLTKVFAIGEVGFNGDIKSSSGFSQFLDVVLSDNNNESIAIIPKTESEPARKYASKIKIFCVDRYSEVIELVKSDFTSIQPLKVSKENISGRYTRQIPEFSIDSITGNYEQKRALLIGVSGRHSMLLAGPMGIGKTILAKSIVEYTPFQAEVEYEETSRINETVNEIYKGSPFIQLEKSITVRELLGGGRFSTVGILSKAHNGYLFLDEVGEYKKELLNNIKSVFDAKKIAHNNQIGDVEIPASFAVIATTNLCPCGKDSKNCTCRYNEKRDFLKRIPDPLLHRLDMYITVKTMKLEQNQLSDALTAKQLLLLSSIVKALQTLRLSGTKYRYNSEIPYSLFKSYCKMTPSAISIIEDSIARYRFSGRDYVKLIQTARTISDLEIAEIIYAVNPELANLEKNELETAITSAIKETEKTVTHLDITENSILEALQYRTNVWRTEAFYAP